jgi:xanthosine utilization system XapX-like protein
MFVQLRKIQDKPFPVFRFIAGILFDIGLIAAVLKFPIIAPAIPMVGLVQSFFGGTAKYEWKWEDAQKKLRFAPLENVAA